MFFSLKVFNKQEIIVSSIFNSDFVQNIVLCIPQSRSKQTMTQTLSYIEIRFFILFYLQTIRFFFVIFCHLPFASNVVLYTHILTFIPVATTTTTWYTVQAFFTEERGRSNEKLLNTCFNIPLELQSCC